MAISLAVQQQYLLLKIFKINVKFMHFRIDGNLNKICIPNHLKSLRKTQVSRLQVKNLKNITIYK